MLTGGFLFFRQAKLVAPAGELPEDLIFTLVSVETNHGAQMAEGADEIPIFIQLHGIEMDIVRHIRLFIAEICCRFFGICYGKTIKLRIIDTLPVPDYFSMVYFCK